MWDITIHLLRGQRPTIKSTPLCGQHPYLAHRLVSTPFKEGRESWHIVSSDTICDNPDPPLADIVLFGLSLSGFSPQDYKTRLLGEGFHTLINGVLFSSPTNMGHHNNEPISGMQ